MLRYRTDETDDGLSGKEGTFLICSFWLVSALAIVGEVQRARDLMERLLRVASPLGLYAEEFDADTGRHLGNFPQAFSHLALIEAAGADHPRRAHRGVQRMSDYDVIVIGSGAGGGTLVHRLAPSGKRILLLERGDWLPREPQNWSAADVFVDNRYVSEDTWYDEHGKPFQPQVHYFVGGATKLYGAALYRLREEDFGELDTTTASRPRGRSPTTSSSPTTRRPSSSTGCTARAARTRPSRRPARPTRSRAVSHEPRIQQLADDLAAAGLHPFHAPCGVMLDEADMPLQRAACAARPATASRAWCTRSPTPRCWPSGPRSSTPTSRCCTNARGAAAARPTRPARAVTEVVVERDGERETYHGRHRGRLLRRGELGEAAARVGQRRAPARARQRLRPGRAQLHVPQQPGGAGALQGGEPDRLPEDARAQRLLLRRPTTSSSRWATSRWSASPRPTCTAARSRWRPSSRRSWTLDDVARHAVDFWLSTEDLPRAENRVTLRRDGDIALSYTADQPRSPSSGSLTSSSRCSGSSGCTSIT